MESAGNATTGPLAGAAVPDCHGEPTARTAFLPAAGLGKRLRPLTDRLPKPLLPVAGVPLLVHVLRRCAAFGVERFLVNTHHRPEAFALAFPDREWEGRPIEFIHEPVRLETGGGLKNIEPFLEPGETLLVHNGDLLADFPLEELAAAHARLGRPSATLAAADGGPDPHLVVDAKGSLLEVDRKEDTRGGSRRQFLGVALVEAPLFRYLRPAVPESVVHGWRRAIDAEPGSIRVHTLARGRWIDVGTVRAYEAVREAGLRSPLVHRLS